MTLGALDRDLLYLLDPVAMVNDRFELGFRLDRVQERIIESHAMRMIVCCSRQWGKTTTVAAKAAAEAWSGPGLILIIAPVERQARELFRKIRTALKLLAGQDAEWPEDNKTSLELPNGARIVALPASGETIRGYTNPRLIIIDEAAFVNDNDYRSIRPMLSHGARLILMSTPFGKRGFFHTIWSSEDSATWERYTVQASECSHIPARFLEEERTELGPAWYSQEYECAFLDAITGYFDMDAVRASIEVGISPLFTLRENGLPEYMDEGIKPLFEVGVA